MRLYIRPGKVTCAGLVGIMMVLPNSLWKGPDAKVQPVAKKKIERVDPGRPSVKFQKAPR